MPWENKNRPRTGRRKVGSHVRKKKLALKRAKK